MWINKIKGLIVRLVRFIYTNNHLVIASIKASNRGATPYDENIVKLSALGSALIDSMTFLSIETKNSVIKELNKGSTVYLYLDETKEVMHYSCLTDSVIIGEIKKKIYMVDGDAYIYNCFTEKEYRGRGLYPKTLSHILNSAEFNHYYIACIFSNVASRKVIDRFGFIYQSHIYYYCLLGVAFSVTSNRQFYKDFFK